MKNEKNISESNLAVAPSRADIKHGMTIAAQLVQRYGPKYWPVLERLKQEYDILDDREELLASLLIDSHSECSRNQFSANIIPSVSPLV